MSDREEADAIRELEVSCSTNRLWFAAYLPVARFFLDYFSIFGRLSSMPRNTSEYPLE